MPRKTSKFRLSRNSTKFYVLIRFCEKNSNSEIRFVIRELENKLRIFNRNYNLVTEITILPFFQKLEFLGSYILPSLKGISSRNSGQLQSITCICNVHSTMHVNSHLNPKRLNHVPSSLNKKGYVARIVFSRSHVDSSTS